MEATSKIKDYIKKQERFLSKAYKDGFINGVQQYSIGYGHQINQALEKSLMTTSITQLYASQLFDKDLKVYESAVNKSKRSLNQNQFDALVDFAYNCGTGAVAKIIEVWNNTGSILQTCAKISLYKNSSGTVNLTLVKRRAYEVALFGGGADLSKK